MDKFFIAQVSDDGKHYKPLKFKVQNQQACMRLLELAKKRNKYVKNALYQFTLPNGQIHTWRFNNTWFKATGMLIPILADVRKSMNLL